MRAHNSNKTTDHSSDNLVSRVSHLPALWSDREREGRREGERERENCLQAQCVVSYHDYHILRTAFLQILPSGVALLLESYTFIKRRSYVS